jgi:hypothetical protein
MTRRLLCLVLLASAVPPALRAASPPSASWQPVGPYGAWTTALLADPKRPGVVFAGTDNGLYRSVDGGATWQTVTEGGLQRTTTLALAAGPSSIYASDWSGLVESRDGGTTWDQVQAGFYITAMDADPVRGTLLVINQLAASNATELWRSTDGAKHWTRVSKVLSPTALAADRGAPGTFYVGTYGGLVFRTADGGATWRSSDLHQQLGFGLLHALAVDPVTHAVYTGGLAPGVFSSTNQGTSWRQVPLPDRSYVRSLAARAGVVYAGAFPPFGAPHVNAVFVSTDGGTKWRGGLQGIGIGIVAIETLAIDPRNPKTVYIGADSWGVFKSTDAVVHWTLASQGLRGSGVNRITLDAGHPGTILAGTDGAGLWKTSDDGATWSLINGSLGAVHGLAQDPRNPATIFVASNGLLQRTLDGGAHWRTLGNGLNTIVTGPLLVDPQWPATVYAGTTSGVFDSHDGGATWSAPVAGAKCTVPLALVSSPAGTVYLGGKPSNCNDEEPGGVFASTDGGAHWQDLGDILLRKVYALAVDPAGPSTLYAGGYGVSSSTDGGASWQDTSKGCAFSVRALALGAGQPVEIYAWSLRQHGCGGDLDLSPPSGVDWRRHQRPRLRSDDRHPLRGLAVRSLLVGDSLTAAPRSQRL